MRTNCHYCGYLCALTAMVEDGKLVAVEPDPSRYPYDSKIMQGCRRWRMVLEDIDAPERMNYPLKRVGGRGSGKWERVSWDEALDDIASRLAALAAEYGPETLASAIGGPHATYWPLHRFLNLFGTPNNMGIGQICWNPRVWMESVTFGWPIEADIRAGVTDTIVLWGTNPAQSDNSLFWRSLVGLSRGKTNFVTIDPRRTQSARISNRWVPIRPGTDCTFALGLLNAIISENLYDHGFVERWCDGFDELAAHVEPFDRARVAHVCGIDAGIVDEVAHLLGGPLPSVIVSGRGIDQIGRDAAPTLRAIDCIRAVTGNVDRAGAGIIQGMSSYTPEVVMELPDYLSQAQRDKCLNTPFTPLQCYTGYDKVLTSTLKAGKRLPVRYLTSAHPSLVWNAMVTGRPYPIRALMVMATNPLLTYGDTHLVHEALSALDLLVVLEQRMTPTARMADYVLPSAGVAERPVFQAHGGIANMAYGGPAAVVPYHERRTDYRILRELGLRLGQDGFWPQKTLEDAYDAMLAQGGSSFEEFCERGYYRVDERPGKHDEVNPTTGEARGFSTASGKVELASSLLSELGGQALPEPFGGGSPVDDGDILLVTGARRQPYYASKYHDVAAFRMRYPRPLAEMSDTTARCLGLADGDEVVVSTERGEARFVLSVASMRDDVVSIDYGWWYPERDTDAPDLCGIWESNANLLTGCDIAEGESMIGSWRYNALPCTVRKG